MKILSFEDILLIHEKVIESTGGVKGLINPGAIETALHRPFSTAFGQDIFPTLWDKAAAFIHAIISFHPFVDGNKRVALIATDVWLKLNDYHIPRGQKVEEFFWKIAKGETTVEDISKWLKEWCMEYSE